MVRFLSKEMNGITETIQTTITKKVGNLGYKGIRVSPSVFTVGRVIVVVRIIFRLLVPGVMDVPILFCGGGVEVVGQTT